MNGKMVFGHDYENFPELSDRQISEFGFSSPHVQITEDFDAVVVKVNDGDTVTLATEFRDFAFPLRFLGIDAPELNEGGEEAREWLRTKIEGMEVQVLVDSSNRVGKYGRLLGRVMFSGLDVGQEMLSLGLVSEFGRKDEGGLPSLGKVLDLGQWLTV